jgi:hypothetical protein
MMYPPTSNPLLAFVDHILAITREEDRWHQPITIVVAAIVIKAL